jgi:hypothetical protein
MAHQRTSGGEFVQKVRQAHVRAVLGDQPFEAVLASPLAMLAREPNHGGR